MGVARAPAALRVAVANTASIERHSNNDEVPERATADGRSGIRPGRHLAQRLRLGREDFSRARKGRLRLPRPSSAFVERILSGC